MVSSCADSFRPRPIVLGAMPVAMRSSLRQVADLILEPGHRLFARHGVEVVRIGLAGPLGGGQPQTFSAFDLIAEELEPVIDMNDPGLLRMEVDPEFVAQE